MSDWQDYYLVLGVDRNANAQEIREAYRFKAFTQHPDRLIGAPESVRLRAEDEIRKLNIAFEILRDPQNRDQYNSEWDLRNGPNAKITRGRNSTIKPKPVVVPPYIYFKTLKSEKLRRRLS